MNVLEFFSKGGPFVYILVSLSLITLTLAVERIIVFFSVASNLRDLADRDREEIRSAATYDATLVEHWLNRLLTVCENPDGTKTQFLTRFRELESILTTRLWLLSLSPRISTLLGLIGTVFGLVRAFIAVEKSGSQLNPAALAGGIWEALLATGIGLTVAVTGWVLSSMLENWLEGLMSQAEAMVAEHPDLFGRFLQEEESEKEPAHVG